MDMFYVEQVYGRYISTETHVHLLCYNMSTAWRLFVESQSSLIRRRHVENDRQFDGQCHVCSRVKDSHMHYLLGKYDRSIVNNEPMVNVGEKC